MLHLQGNGAHSGGFAVEQHNNDRREEEYAAKKAQHQHLHIDSNPAHNGSEFDIGAPRVVRQSVQLLLQKWGANNIKPISPQDFLYNLLRSRGYPAHLIATNELKQQV